MGEICIESGWCFASFAEAMAAQPLGGTLTVAEGEYYEAIGVDVPLRLQSDAAASGAPRPVLHSPGGGRAILVVTGAGVVVDGVDFDAVDGRVFEATGGASLSFADVRLHGSSGLAVGGLGLVRDGALDLQNVDLYGGTAQFGGQLYLEDSGLTAFQVVSIGGVATAMGGGIIEIRDTDGAVEQSIVEYLEVFDARAPALGGALVIDGGSLSCQACAFDNVEGTAIFASNADVEVGAGTFRSTGVAVYAASQGTLSVLDSRFEGGGVYALNLTYAEVERSSFFGVASPIYLGVNRSRVVGDLFCGFAGLGAVRVERKNGTSLIANSRFVGGVGDSVIEVSSVSGTGTAEISHNDFVANTATVLLSSRQYGSPQLVERDRFVDNVVVGQRGAEVVARGNALGQVATNLGWDNDGAPWTDDGRVGLDAPPGWSPVEVADLCGDEHDGWWGQVGPWPTWRYLGRDAGSGAPDPDETPSDVGAVGGPEATVFVGLWGDADGDAWPLVYDCADDDPTANPDAVDEPYDGVDRDCDGYSDDDADLDGYDVGVDCDDHDLTVHPGASDYPNDTIDQDCDGDRDWDGDGYVWPEDCDDDDASRHPGAVEDPDTDGVFGGGIDRDCDGIADVPLPLSVVCATTPAGSFPWIIACVVSLRRSRSRRSV